MSVSPEDCIYPGCRNCASVNTYPVCYEHLDYFSQQRSQPHQQLPTAAAAAAGMEGMQNHTLKNFIAYVSPEIYLGLSSG